MQFVGNVVRIFDFRWMVWQLRVHTLRLFMALTNYVIAQKNIWFFYVLAIYYIMFYCIPEYTSSLSG